MVTLKTIADRREQILALASKYLTGDLRVFGSVARGAQQPRSDVDFLVRLKPGCSLFDLGGLLEEPQDLLHCRVDLVTEDGLKPRLREQVLREAIAV